MELTIGNLSGFFDGYEYTKGPVSIRIEEGKIAEINFAETTNSDIDGRGKILTPPFNDGHTHLIFGGTRFFELSLKLQGKSYNEILEQGGGITYTVEKTREASDSELLAHVKGILDEMLKHGTLRVEAKSGYGLSTEHELRLLRILQQAQASHDVDIIPTFGAAHVFPRDKSRAQYVDEIIDEMLPVVKKEGLATSTDVFCDKGAFSVEETISIFDEAKKLDMPVRVHAEELEYTGIGKITAEKYNALSADHLLLARQDDFQTLADHNTVAMFMPLAPLGLFTDNRPHGFNQTDVTIGLGSDFNPNNWTTSMQSAIRMAVFSYRMTPVEALKAATTGSYQGITGKKQPPILQDSHATFNLITANSIDEFVSKFGRNLVSHVIKDGKLLVEN